MLMTEAKRHTYFVPPDLHRRLKIHAITHGKNISEMVVEGIQLILRKGEQEFRTRNLNEGSQDG